MQNEFMLAAIAEARHAAECGEVPVGAVVVKDGRVIAAAHNLCESKGNALLHAEVIAIDKACRVLKSSRLDDCDMYVTLEPCAMCCGAISHARIRRLFFGAYDRLAGCVESNIQLFSSGSPLRYVEYYCGLMENECSEIISDFFKKIRRTSITPD